MAWVYILDCSDGSFYTGSTVNLEVRLWQHNFGAQGEGANYTRKRRPVTLVFSEQFEDVGDAFAAEKKVQGWSRAKKIALIEGRAFDLPALSHTRAEVSEPIERSTGPHPA